MTNIADVSVWLANHVRTNMTIGIDIQANIEDKVATDYVIAFATRTPGDEVVMAGKAGDEGVAMLRRFLDVKEGIKLVPFSTPEAVVMLFLITGIEPKVLLERVVGDVFSVEYTIGRGHTPAPDPIEEARYAVTFWTGAQQMSLPKYYKAVMEPLQRIMATPVPDEGQGWMVRFSELPQRVIAKYSREPLLMRAFMADEFPSHGRFKGALQEAYPDIDHQQAYAALWYAALGGDFEYLSREYPQLAKTIADWDRDALGHNLDKYAPQVRLMASALWQAGGPARQVETLYGRRLPFEPDPQQGPGVFLDHVLAGTVIDLIHVFCVSAANLGLHVSVPFLSGAETTIDVWGKMEGDTIERLNQLKAIAALGGPLNPVPLAPTVILENENGQGIKG